jgi:LPXTG-motif cell wall-anchored protein
MGRLRLLKQDKFGTLGAGFEFTLYADYKCTEPVSVFSTDSNGIAISDWLPQGRYYLKETKLPEGSLHVLGTMSYSIDILTGETYEITFSNLLQAGKIGVHKADDAGTPMTGIVFGVYSDPECTKMAAMPFRTDENGVALCELEPGNYYVKELTKNPQYILDTTVYPVTVTAKTTTYINQGEPVINTRKSKIELIKKDPDGILSAGYVFGIYSDEACMELLQTVTTDGTGTSFSDWLLPDKTYYVKEISLPEDDTIHAVSKEVFPLKLLPGEVGKVTVINEFLPGQITVLKTSQEGQKLSGAKFLLEWSEDGRKWQKVVYNADRVIKGSCSNEDLTDGCLVTDSTGVITFTGLHPTLQYRITEIEAPEGYVLITEPVYTGTLPPDTLELGFTVVNAKPFELPQTGSKPMILMPVSLLLCTATCMGIFVYLRKKKKEV